MKIKIEIETDESSYSSPSDDTIKRYIKKTLKAIGANGWQPCEFNIMAGEKFVNGQYEKKMIGTVKVTR